ncbi:short chain dehydrogenase [Fontibacillus panacisegetis]|uniref:Short chain dehydrogenase n=1 Tax=Fontibacillus panacisegetis TaxID=670482 RepID=A0A1G7GXU0_9BACL|nr:short chain dehydrogenase [Fontibacillus panacisegetis]
MIETIERELGTIDILVNNAGITRYIPFEDLEAVTEEIWDELYATNVKGMLYCARAVAPFMKKHHQGAVVNIGSIAGQTGLGSSLPYAVFKAAVHGLTKSLAYALAPHIKVNCVVPGAVATRWWDGREEMMRKLASNLPVEEKISFIFENEMILKKIEEVFSLILTEIALKCEKSAYNTKIEELSSFIL